MGRVGRVGYVGRDMWGGETARPGSLPPPHVAIYRISVEGSVTKDVWGGGYSIFRINYKTLTHLSNKY